MSANEIPWAWYLTRSAGIAGFLLLYSVMFLGLAIRTPFLKKIIQPCYSYSVHCWLSLQALFFVFIHGIALLFDNFFGFSLGDIFVPWVFKSESLNTNFLALGIIGFYLMIILTVSSYARRLIGQKAWRFIHFLNILLYVFVVVHAYFLGTDLKNPTIREIFIWVNAFLVFLMLNSLAFRFIKDEDIHKNDSACQSE